MRAFKKLLLLQVSILLSGWAHSQLLGGEFGYERLGSDELYVEMSIYHPVDVTLPDTMEFEVDWQPHPITRKYETLLCDSVEKTVYDTVLQPFDGNLLALIDSSFYRGTVNTPGIDSMYSFSTRVNVQGLFFFESHSGRFYDKGVKKVETGDSLIYHPAYSNPDHDEMLFQLESIGDSTKHWIPDDMEIHPLSGELSWTAPDSTGGYEIIVYQREWNGNTLKGREYKHMTVEVVDSLATEASFNEISGFERDSTGHVSRTIDPGEQLELQFQFEDSIADSVVLETVGEPLNLLNPGYVAKSSSDSLVDASFSWTPDSSQARAYPYVLTFIGKSYPSCTWHYKTVIIHVEDPTTSIEEEQRAKDQNGFTVRPNPAEDELFLNSSLDLSQHELRILNAQGQMVKEVQLRPGQERIDVQDLDSGIYFLVLQGRDGRWQERFVKE